MLGRFVIYGRYWISRLLQESKALCNSSLGSECFYEFEWHTSSDSDMVDADMAFVITKYCGADISCMCSSDTNGGGSPHHQGPIWF